MTTPKATTFVRCVRVEWRIFPTKGTHHIWVFPSRGGCRGTQGPQLRTLKSARKCKILLLLGGFLTYLNYKEKHKKLQSGPLLSSADGISFSIFSRRFKIGERGRALY